jgi:hypothetical protein
MTIRGSHAVAISFLSALLAMPVLAVSPPNGVPTGMVGMAGTASMSDFDSELAAVVAAATRYNPISIEEDREYMGAVLRQGDRYLYTVAPGQSGRDRITVRVPIPDGYQVIAFWHTHGDRAHGRTFFSDVDTRLVRDSDKPFYLADFTGVLKVFSPSDRTMSRLRARHLGLPGKAGFARGELVRDVSGSLIRVPTTVPGLTF